MWLRYIQSFLGLFNFFLHSTILTILYSSRKTRKQRSIQLLSTVSIGHTLAGLATFATLFNDKANALAVAFLVQGNIGLLCYSVDRCLKIRLPFLYGNLPVGFHVAAVLPSPLLDTTLCTRSVLSWGNEKKQKSDITPNFNVAIFLSISFFVEAILLLITNTFVYATLVRQQKEIGKFIPRQQQQHQQRPQQQQPQQQQPQHPQQQQPQQQQSQHQQQQPRHEKGKFESFYVSLGYAFTFIVLWIPTFIYIIYRLDLYIRQNIPMKLVPPVLRLLYVVNMLCDGMIVVLVKKHVKKKFKRFFKTN